MIYPTCVRNQYNFSVSFYESFSETTIRKIYHHYDVIFYTVIKQGNTK